MSGTDVCERDIDIFEPLNAEFGFGGIAAERLITENLEKMNEYDLETGNLLSAELTGCLAQGTRLRGSERTPSERSLTRSLMMRSRAFNLLLSLDHGNE